MEIDVWPPLLQRIQLLITSWHWRKKNHSLESTNSYTNTEIPYHEKPPKTEGSLWKTYCTNTVHRKQTMHSEQHSDQPEWTVQVPAMSDYWPVCLYIFCGLQAHMLIVISMWACRQQKMLFLCLQEEETGVNNSCCRSSLNITISGTW